MFLRLKYISCRYNISWAVDSHTPVEEFKLYFRRMPRGVNGEDPIVLHNGYSEPLQHQSLQTYGRRGMHIKVSSRVYLKIEFK